MLTTLVFSSALLDNRDADPDRQFSNRRRKINLFILHDEPEDTSTNPAAEAVKCLPLRIDVKRWRLLLMKRAKRFEIRSRALQRKIRSNNFDDIVCSCDLFDCFGSNHRFDFSLVWIVKRCQIYPTPQWFPTDEKIVDPQCASGLSAAPAGLRPRCHSQRRRRGCSAPRRDFFFASHVSAAGGEASRNKRGERNHF